MTDTLREMLAVRLYGMDYDVESFPCNEQHPDTLKKYRKRADPLIGVFKAHTEREDALDAVARLIAENIGPDYDTAFKDKAEWTASQGCRGEHFLSINDATKCDYDEAAKYALAGLFIERDGDG